MKDVCVNKTLIYTVSLSFNSFKTRTYSILVVVRGSFSSHDNCGSAPVD